MTKVETILPEAPAGHFWRLYQDDTFLMLELRYGNLDESSSIYKCPVTTASQDDALLEGLLEDTARMILRNAYPPKKDWSSIVGDYGV